ncbi:MAG: LacI family DNA-binding transcriptional regulator [Rectinemataceae bacterium]|jgi:DNA-binding LacI/PurR family transcriptional regulator
MKDKDPSAKRRTKEVTIKEVALRAKVSVATVSRVLNNNSLVKDHLRKAVLDAIQDLNYEYKPSSSPRGGRVKLHRIGLVLPNIVNPYFALLIKGILGSALVRNAEVIIYNSDECEETEEQHFTRIAQADIQGIIYIPFSKKVDPAVPKLIEDKFPLVFLDRALERNDICTVASDNVEGAYQAATYLLNLGHRDIVYISHSPHLSTSVSRFEGFKRGLEEFGLKVNKDLVITGDTTFEKGFQEVQKLLKSKKRFTAVFSSNDMMAFGAWEAAKEAGLQVPKDLSIIGYDEIPFSSYLSLTTIAQPSYEIGQSALSLVIDLIEGRRVAPQAILLRDSLIIRKSCMKI